MGAGLGLVILLCGGAASAAGQVDLSEWPQVKMTVLPLDEQDFPITGVTAEALVVREDGRAQTVVNLEPDVEPQSVCLMIDASGSMYDRLPNVHAAAERLLQNLPPEDEVCVADFSRNIYMDQMFTSDRKSAVTALQYIKASGGTALRDSLYELSVYMRNKARYRSRVIILVSDVSDNASAYGEDRLKVEMETSGIPVVHVLCVPSARARGCGADEKVALRLTGMGGGLVYFPRSAADTDAAVDHLTTAMKARYILTYAPVNAAPDGSQRRVDVSFDKAHQSKKAIVRAPEGYYAPSR